MKSFGLLFLLFLGVCVGTASASNTVSGTVTLGSATGSAAYPAIVYLIKKSYNSGISAYTLTKLDSTNTASNGEYHFYNVTASAGDLLVKCALLSSNANYSGYLPTYKENSLTWSTAHTVSFTLGANDIHMIAGTNAGGPGFIGGSVLLGANKGLAVGDGLDQRILLLTTDTDVPVAYTYSNASGQFSFPALAYGTYKVFGDAWGKTNPPLMVTISAANPSVSNIIFDENSQSFSARSLGIGNPVAYNTVRCYPIPAGELLQVVGLNGISGLKTISMRNVAGAKVVTQSTQGSELSIPVGGLAPGIYILQIQSAAGTAAYTIVK